MIDTKECFSNWWKTLKLVFLGVQSCLVYSNDLPTGVTTNVQLLADVTSLFQLCMILQQYQYHSTMTYSQFLNGFSNGKWYSTQMSQNISKRFFLRKQLQLTMQLFTFTMFQELAETSRNILVWFLILS